MQISIHALREEGDADGVASRLRKGISIHALREEGDLGLFGLLLNDGLFLSTPSARRATMPLALVALASLFLSTPSARRATDKAYGKNRSEKISIHALREEGDLVARLDDLTQQEFLSTPSARRATRTGTALWARMVYFYPRPPRGGRRIDVL